MDEIPQSTTGSSSKLDCQYGKIPSEEQQISEEDGFKMLWESPEETSEQMTESPSNVCRICHGSNSQENYLSPCRCRGTVSKVHRTCLEHWLAESDTSYCEICGHMYVTERVPQYNALTSVFKWLTSDETFQDVREFLIDFVFLCIFTPIIIISTYSGFVITENIYRMDIVTSTIHIPLTPTRLISLIVILFISTLDLFYSSWILIRFQHHFSQWHRWWRRKCLVRLVIDINEKVLTSRTREIEQHSYSFE